MKTIYNTYVIMESQEQCDRMKQLCIDNGLPIWNNEIAFELLHLSKFFRFLFQDFFVGSLTLESKEITEQEFIELLKTTK